jgi:hypothetical protein
MQPARRLVERHVAGLDREADRMRARRGHGLTSFTATRVAINSVTSGSVTRNLGSVSDFLIVDNAISAREVSLVLDREYSDALQASSSMVSFVS